MGENSSNFIKVGPDGDSTWDEKGKTKIVQIFVSHGSRVASIQFQYADENGTLVLSDRHGVNHYSKFDVVKLNYPSEYITRISGHRSRPKGLSSVTFGTNHGEYGPFGQVTTDNEKFCYEVGERQFGGFYGTARSCSPSGVKSIGVYLEPNMSSKYTDVKIEIVGANNYRGSLPKKKMKK